MIECLRDDKGNIKAVCEWLLFNENGEPEYNGCNMMICQVEINPEYRGNGILKTFITILLGKNPQAKKCSWIRDKKYPERNPRFYTREQFERIGE